MKRKEVVIGAGGIVLAIVALVAVVLVWSTVNNLGERASALEQKLTEAENTMDELGDEVDDLEQKLTEAENTMDELETRADDLGQRLSTIENKTWHTVGEYTLSSSKTSQEFNIQGEEWRLNFVFSQVVAGIQTGYNIRVYDASGNIVGGLSGIELADIENEHCILNIREGQGDFTVEVSGMASDFTFLFTVEEFY